MVLTTEHPGPTGRGLHSPIAERQGPRRRLLAELDRPGQVFEHITPNWFASVMGTGIVATAAASLPVQPPGLRLFATALWLFASVALVLLTVAFAVHWLRHPQTAKMYAAHPVMSQFYGAPAMALLTVGAGTMLIGVDVVGTGAAVAIDGFLWCAGTALGLFTSVWVPYTMMTSHSREDVIALPAWLMPIVPPMVSATTGAFLIPHVPEGQWRLGLLSACYALFGLSLFLGMITMTLIYSRLVHGGAPVAQTAPTVWITLGMIGQSVTAVNVLAVQSATVFTGDEAYIALGLHVFGIVYGLAMGGFGVAMFALATSITVRAVRRGMPFALTWWSFTFPVGTCVTGMSALGAALGSGPVRVLAILLYVLLIGAWATVAAKTLRGTASGRTLLPA
ncbi:TDT family transporter [Gordonia rhizosphera]|nr:TDT family transporter [Gordonia rhizosphera]